MKNPKFSVCIPTYNRASSLKIAIESVLKQDFDDYEIIISDNNSTDNTKEMVGLFNNPKIKYFKNEENIGMIKNWNRTLELAEGEYIAFLFDDDEFAPNHLKEAFKILNGHSNIGIYAVGNKENPRPITGIIDSKKYFQYIYKIENVSTPSETIFKREFNNKKYFYNKNYNFCPEVELYLEIANDDFLAYHSPLQTVIRHSHAKSASHEQAFSWVPFADKFKIINKYKNHKYVNSNLYRKAVSLNINSAFEKYTVGRIQNIGDEKEIFEGIKKVLQKEFPFKYCKILMMKKIINIIAKYHLINIVKIKRIYHLLGK